MEQLSIPAGAEYVRTTPTFTRDTVPKGLLSDHRVAAGAWGLLTVLTGALVFRFDDVDEPLPVSAGESQVIPPLRYHHLELDKPVTFRIEFFRVDGQADVTCAVARPTG